MVNQDFNSIFELFDRFPTEQSCIDHLEWLRWNGDVVSPWDPSSVVYKCKDNKYRCKNTGKYFNVKTNTLFDSTKISLRKWFAAIWLVTCHKRGVSSIQLSRDIGVTQKTAWFMLHRIRKAFGITNDDNTGIGGEIEIDETFVGGRNKNRHKDKKVEKCQGRSFKDKVPVFGMLQRGGILIAEVVSDTKGSTLYNVIRRYVTEGSIIYTDGWVYGNIQNNYQQYSVDHGRGFYGTNFITAYSELISINTNKIENAWTHLKRMIVGTYYKMSKRHLQSYIDEFVFRFNTRNETTSQRFNMLLSNLECRLTYRELIYG
jgi:transposase-like protein